VRGHLDRIGVTLGMSIPAHLGAHIQRSIFILPASASFVNATSMHALGNSCLTGGAAIPSALAGPLPLGAERLAEKICFSLFILPLYPVALGSRSLGRRSHGVASGFIILCTRIFNLKCYTPPYQTQITPCRPCRHRGSVPTGGQPWIHKR
jgi:hypothetical protein